MRKFGIPTTTIAATALALPAYASLPPAGQEFELNDLEYSAPEPPKPTRDELLAKFWNHYQSQVSECIIPEGEPNEISLVQSPEAGLNPLATCDGYLDYNSNQYADMMAIGEQIISSTSLQCGYITLQGFGSEDFTVGGATLDGALDCNAALDEVFPAAFFSTEIEDGEPVLKPEGFLPEMCTDDHNDEDIADYCWKLRGTDGL